MKYSVIIPIFNAAATIQRCLDSLLNHPHEDVEILLINDGSTDASGEICRRYARAHGCVRYLEKENGGVSSARNLGLEAAAGEYILFVDSDDYVSADYFPVIDAALARWKPDMLLFGLQCFDGQDGIWQTGNFFSADAPEISRFVRRAVQAYLYSNLMTKSFRRDVILENHLRFDEALLIGEDQAFIFAYTMHVKKLASIDQVLYHYSRDNSNSLSQRNREYLTEQLLRVSCLMQQALQEAGHPEPVRRVYQQAVSWSHYRSAYSACKELLKFSYSASARRNRIRQICGSFCSAGIPATGFWARLIALPISGKMSWLIDSLSCHSHFYKKLLQ